MKKLLFTISVFIIAITAYPALGAEYEECDFYPFGAGEIVSRYDEGTLGDELYLFYTDNSWGNDTFSAVTVTDGSATLIYGKDSAGAKEPCRSKQLSEEEYALLNNYMSEHQVDELPDWDTHSIFDGVNYYLLHLTREKKSFLHMNNPGATNMFDDYISRFGDDSVYSGLVDLFDSLTASVAAKSGPDYMTVAKSIEAMRRDENGLKVCIEEGYYNFQWYYLNDDGSYGDPAPEPEDLGLMSFDYDYPALNSAAGSTNPAGRTKFYYNGYPWRCEWKGYRVRVPEFQSADHGLWLTSPTEPPRKLASGEYTYPLVIPERDMVICGKESGSSSTLVRIDLNTGEETDMGFEPYRSINAVCTFGDWVLIYCVQNTINPDTRKYYQDDYLWNMDTHETCHVNGIFPHIYIGSDTAPPQKAAGTNGYYIAEYDSESRRTVINIFDADTLSFTPLMAVPSVSFSSQGMWVDEEKSFIYVFGDRLTNIMKIPFDVSARLSAPAVRINGQAAAFFNPSTIKDGVTYVGEEIFDMLGAEALTGEDGTLHLWRGDIYAAVQSGGAPGEGYYPLRAVCEALGATVEWNGDDNAVEITTLPVDGAYPSLADKIMAAAK